MLGRRKDTVIRGFRLFDGIARLARDLKSYLWVADPRQFPFLCSYKKKEPKESTPRSARRLRRFPPFLAPPGARQLAGRTLRASGSNTGSLKSSRWGCGTRRALRGFENTNGAMVFFHPRMAHPSSVRLWASAPKGSRTGRCATGPRPRKARWGSAGPQSRGGEDQCAIRGVLLFG